MQELTTLLNRNILRSRFLSLLTPEAIQYNSIQSVKKVWRLIRMLTFSKGQSLATVLAQKCIPALFASALFSQFVFHLKLTSCTCYGARAPDGLNSWWCQRAWYSSCSRLCAKVVVVTPSECDWSKVIDRSGTINRVNFAQDENR